jgi:hypothetical protein
VLVAAAVCPHPPLLVPRLAAGAAGELDDLRAACVQALEQVLATEPELLVVVGAAPRTGPYEEGARGSLRGFGVDVVVGKGDAAPDLPLSLTVGEWLVLESGVPVPRLHFGLEPDLPPARAAALGAGLAERTDRVALLVMGDGSARRSAKGPGYLDDRAEPFDDGVARALADVDIDALLALDAERCSELLVGGRVAWQALVGAADGGGAYEGTLLRHEAPYGVAYLVATWFPRGTEPAARSGD